MITQTFDLNLIPDSEPVVVHVNQYDEGEGRFVINLYDGAVAYTPSANATAVIQGTKADGKGFDYDAELSGNTVTADLTAQMTAFAGIARCQVVITEGGNITGTFVFHMDVQKSALPADTDMSESEYQVVERLLREAEAATHNVPYIGANGNWWVWSTEQQAYVDSGVDASISVDIADITMLAPDATPYVTNSGTDTDPIFHLFIPRGKGISGVAKTGTVGLVDTYTITYSDGATTTFNVTNGAKGDKGDTGEQGIQGEKGDKGDTGLTPNISATATVNNNVGIPSVNVTKSGTVDNPSFAFAFQNLKGDKGDKGDTGNTGAQGPQGATGPQGEQGPQGIQGPQGVKGDTGDTATVSVGTVSTLPAGSNATVTNTGTPEAAVFNFGIPKGRDGEGAGDMTKAEYDPDNAVALAGGIADYVTNKDSAVEQLLKDTVGWTGKNQLLYNATSQTLNGITFTVNRNSDGGVTDIDADGTSTGIATFHLVRSVGSALQWVNGFKLSGSIDGDDDTYFIRIVMKNSPWTVYSKQTNDEVIVSGIPNDSTEIDVDILVLPGITLSHKKFYPMLCRADIEDGTYEPYHDNVETITDSIRSEQTILGAKNLIVYPHSEMNRTVNGITFTNNSDGSVTISGVATATATTMLNNGSNHNSHYSPYMGKKLIASGGISSDISVRLWNPGGDVFVNSGGDTEFTLPNFEITNWNVYIRVASGTDLTTPITIYPMLRLASDPDDTYVPYAMTNRELTEELTTVQESAFILPQDSVGTVDYNKIYKYGKIVFVQLIISNFSSEAWTTFASIPIGFRPVHNNTIINAVRNVSPITCFAAASGNLELASSFAEGKLYLSTTWITS